MAGPITIPLDVSEAGVGVISCRSESGSAQLALDTGASQAIQLPRGSPVFEGLAVIGQERSANADGQLRRRRVYEVPNVTIGGTRVGTVRVIEGDELPAIYGVDGLLGLELFRDLTLDIDFPSERLVVWPPGELPDDFAQQEWIVAPIVDKEYGISIEIRIDDHPEAFRVMLDSGAIAYGSKIHYGILNLPQLLRGSADVSSEPAVYRADAVRIGDGVIGPMRFLDLEFPEPPGHDGFLGNALLINHRVVIDPSRNTLYITKTE